MQAENTTSAAVSNVRLPTSAHHDANLLLTNLQQRHAEAVSDDTPVTKFTSQAVEMAHIRVLIREHPHRAIARARVAPSLTERFFMLTANLQLRRTKQSLYSATVLQVRSSIHRISRRPPLVQQPKLPGA